MNGKFLARMVILLSAPKLTKETRAKKRNNTKKINESSKKVF